MIPLLVMMLFPRLREDATTAHPFRRELLLAARDQPGATLGELARALEVHYKTALHHARVLSSDGLVALVEHEGRRRVFPSGHARPPSAPRAVRALHALAHGPRGPAEVARALGVPRGTAGSLLEGLARRGLVEREGAAWRLSERARAALPGATGAT